MVVLMVNMNAHMMAHMMVNSSDRDQHDEQTLRKQMVRHGQSLDMHLEDLSQTLHKLMVFLA